MTRQSGHDRCTHQAAGGRCGIRHVRYSSGESAPAAWNQCRRLAPVVRQRNNGLVPIRLRGQVLHRVRCAVSAKSASTLVGSSPQIVELAGNTSPPRNPVRCRLAGLDLGNWFGDAVVVLGP